MPRYSICGWRLQSEIKLGGVRTHADVDAPDVVIGLGRIAANLGDGVAIGRVLRRLDNGDFLFDPDDVAKAQIRDGAHVVIDPRPGTTPGEVQAFVLGPILALLGHLRGCLPLHASCVEMPCGAVAFSGRAGAGKSSLAAGLARRGYPLLAEDVCVVETTASRPSVLSAAPLVKLDRASRSALALDSGETMVRRKRFVRMPDRPVAAPARLTRIFFLEHGPKDEAPGIVALSRAEALALVHGAILMPVVPAALHPEADPFADALKIATSAHVMRLVWPFDFERIGETLDMIERTGAVRTAA